MALPVPGRNTVRGPGFQRTDLSVFKNFVFASRHRVQLRIEGFNIWNQARFGQPPPSVTAGTIFQDTRTPLPTWFRAIWWVTSQKTGASAVGPEENTPGPAGEKTATRHADGTACATLPDVID